MNNIINETEYRFHKSEDLLQIAELEKVIFSLPWSLSALNEFVSHDTGRILVASNGGIVVGYITFNTVLDEIQIANIAVHPSYRRMNIGINLLKMLYESAIVDKMSVITLEVRQSNEPAISLYKKCGYETVGTRKNYYSNPKEDAILMNLYLTKGTDNR